MRAVVQRVQKASVSVDGEEVGAIERGLLVYLGVAADDTGQDLSYMARKLANMRIFEDDAGKMNLNVSQAGGQVLLVSQFTLFGDMRKGNRPSFVQAAQPEMAERDYLKLAEMLRNEFDLHVELGRFRAHMSVKSENDGPINMLIDSRKAF